MVTITFRQVDKSGEFLKKSWKFGNDVSHHKPGERFLEVFDKDGDPIASVSVDDIICVDFQ